MADFTDQGQTGMTDQTGVVYRLSVDGKLDTLLSNGISPNGLVLSSDQKVSDQPPNRVDI
jgi:sugar lactone lactonase YvrE